MSRGEWGFVAGLVAFFVFGFLPPFFLFWRFVVAVAVALGLA